MTDYASALKSPNSTQLVELKLPKTQFDSGGHQGNPAMRTRKRALLNLPPPPRSFRLAETHLPARILQLPRLTLIDVISRLPVDSIFDCRCVCKRFFHLISDPDFVRIQLDRSPIGILIKTLPPTNESKRLQLAQIEDNDGGFQARKLSFTPKDNVPTMKFSHMASCNGLLCLSGPEKEDPIYVCNPILGEYISIETPHKDRTPGGFWGLGCCPVTGQYKVLQTYYPLNDPNCTYKEAEIYTLGSGSWRSIGLAPKDLVSLPFNGFLNGALHWVPCTPNGSEFIHRFDFAREQFSAVPPPSHFQQGDKKYTDFLKIGVLGGCLYIISFNNSLRFEIWVMKEYGVQESWTKQFVVENLYPKHSTWNYYEPVVNSKNGEILMLYNNDVIVCYNPKRKCLRATKFFRTRSSFTATSLTPSFISLHNVAKGENVSRMREINKCDIQYKEDFYNCAGCGVPVMNSGYNLAGLGALGTNSSGGIDGRETKIFCATCGSHLVTPEKSFLSLWSL